MNASSRTDETWNTNQTASASPSTTRPARNAIHGAAATARSTTSSLGVAGGSVPASLALTP